MTQTQPSTHWLWRLSLAGIVMGFTVLGSAQATGDQPGSQSDSSLSPTVRELADQVRELRAAVAELRSEAASYRAETAELRHELQATREHLSASISTPTEKPVEVPAANGLEDRVAALEESSQLLSGKVDEQYQTKIESASRYKLRLSGIALFNLYANHGPLDNADVPDYVPAPSAFNSGNSVGATLRQSELGLEIFGPRLAGARTSGNLQVDFSGGFPNTLSGANYGVLRLRTASMRMDWQNTSLVVGQDMLFLSPESPTSFASLSEPALSYSGNLWAWTPQIRLEHRFALGDEQDITLQGGILDNFTGEPPFTAPDRQKQAGESSGQPAYGMRLAWTRKLFAQPLTIGAAGYYSRQNWGFNRKVDGWAGLMDWSVPLSQRLLLSGEFYRGRAIGGLGGGTGRSTLYSGTIFTPSTQVIGLDTVGGWSQLKFRATARLEFNGAAGLDNPFADDVRAFPGSVSYADPTLTQNRSAFVNFVYHARSNLLFSSEYRRFQTFVIDKTSHSAGQMNMMMGILF